MRALILWACLLSGCSSMYYGALDSIGIPKRDIMVHRVEKARDTQLEAKEQFKSALQQFTELTQYHGGDLETTYHKLDAEYQASVDKAQQVRKRIDDIEDVSQALFAEWREELEQYSSASLRRSSENKLKATELQYHQLIDVMNRAESKIAPVLTVLKDQVLFLKHNLNAQAIASLKGELSTIQTDVSALIAAMEKSINEADAFIKSIETN